MPALTMRQWAEEKKSGTVELLMTKPVTEWEPCSASTAATAGLLVVLLLLTIPWRSAWPACRPAGSTPASWWRATSARCSWRPGLPGHRHLGQLAHREPDRRFILGVVLIFVLLIIGNISMLVSASWVLPLEYLGIGRHFSSISRGVIDSRDLIYYGSVIFLFLYLTARTVESRKWS
jgi:ABC-2 type transport system permease protein